MRIFTAGAAGHLGQHLWGAGCGAALEAGAAGSRCGAALRAGVVRPIGRAHFAQFCGGANNFAACAAFWGLMLQARAVISYNGEWGEAVPSSS